jgi:hypothetical protein
MSTLLEGELEAALSALGRAWLWVLAFGVVETWRSACPDL